VTNGLCKRQASAPRRRDFLPLPEGMRREPGIRRLQSSSGRRAACDRSATFRPSLCAPDGVYTAEASVARLRVRRLLTMEAAASSR
jgi:hypothetical protein